MLKRKIMNELIEWKNTKSASFDKTLKNFNVVGIKISAKNIGFNEKFLSIPHYMAFLL
jgi:hypothetical protein